jgi:hypothetical protein
MTAFCAAAIKGRLMRVIKLDTCGIPVSGVGGGVVTSDGFISIKSTPQYEDGAEFIQRNANGALCVNEKDAPQLKRVELEVMLCTMDPDLIVIVTGDRLLSTSATGTGVAFGEGLVTVRFSLETWQNVTGPAACDPGGSQRYLYWAWGNLGNAKIGDWSIENGVLQFKFTCESKAVNAAWGAKPTATKPNDYLDGVGFVTTEHYAYNVTTKTPPTAACGAVVLT